jgi:membrane fusion protein (multidrug efflux system)
MMRHINLLAAVGLLLSSAASWAEPALDSSVLIETAAPRKQLLKRTVGGFGTVATSEDAVVVINFLHAGQISLLRVRPGQVVNAGQDLIELSIDPAATLSYQTAVTALDFAKRDLARTKTLLAQRLATNAQVAAAQKALEDATAALEAQRKLGNDRTTEVAKAPFAGYVMAVSVALADRVQPNTTVLKLARTDRVQVTVGLEPEDAARVRAGMAAEVVPVFNPNGRMNGVVRGVTGTINPVTKWVDVWVEVSSAGQSLVPGTAVSVEIVLEQHTGWVVPRDAVLRDAKGDYIFQVSGSTALRVPVTTGIEVDGTTEISGPIDPNRQIVTVGNYELHDGMTVRESGPK